MERYPAREAQVGGLGVRRILPQRARRTVGAWCFLDHFGPTLPEQRYRMTVGPHPHIGLQTVTWLLEGEAVHTDSLGSEQVIRPGGLNLMSAGNGIAHAEETPRGAEGVMHGIQFWVAQPETTRHGPPDFEHHPRVPEVALGASAARVLVGSLHGVDSPARCDTSIVGAELSLAAGSTAVAVEPSHEHALVVLDGEVGVTARGEGDGREATARPDELVVVEPGAQQLVLATRSAARAMLLGGEPFESPVLMWWNFVARDREEVDRALSEWESGSDRFGGVDSGLEPIPAPRTPWVSGETRPRRGPSG